MAVCHVGGAGAAAGVWKRPGVTGEKPGAVAGASAGWGSDSRPGEPSFWRTSTVSSPPLTSREFHWMREQGDRSLLWLIFCSRRSFLVETKVFGANLTISFKKDFDFFVQAHFSTNQLVSRFFYEQIVHDSFWSHLVVLLRRFLSCHVGV